ncbi:barrier-to-autointegration factor-like isoform X2 [Tachypleus tridentatus]|uniref:barrier-to-autointegration factor-like isoform X2 n=1 Tax=Tachypleus tridentatus TaxID=6853 RepID=UPI003FD1B5BE
MYTFISVSFVKKTTSKVITSFLGYEALKLSQVHDKYNNEIHFLRGVKTVKKLTSFFFSWSLEEKKFNQNHLLLFKEVPKSKMSSTSQKHTNFVSEPMGDKAVTDLAGIGEVLGKRLGSKGYDKAYVVLGQFLVLKKNKELFIDWLKDAAGANSKQASDCYQCLRDWCEEFL